MPQFLAGPFRPVGGKVMGSPPVWSANLT